MKIIVNSNIFSEKGYKKHATINSRGEKVNGWIRKSRYGGRFHAFRTGERAEVTEYEFHYDRTIDNKHRTLPEPKILNEEYERLLRKKKPKDFYKVSIKFKTRSKFNPLRYLLGKFKKLK